MHDAGMSARVWEALERTEIMALSTLGPDGNWTSPVQYRYKGTGFERFHGDKKQPVCLAAEVTTT